MQIKKFKTIVTSLLAVTLSAAAYAQSGPVMVTGCVKEGDANGEELTGVAVSVKGAIGGVITDIFGNYNIQAPADGILTFTYVGYTPQEVAIKGRTTIDVYMQPLSNDLDELVVIGYGVQRKSDITGSISSVDGKALNDVPVASALQALQGKAAGVNIIQNTGAPGSATTIKIRGTGTINDADPLYVVDGFIVDDITHINPSDIANVEVFKDAASSAVYGSRAANGVVAITTKSGAEGKTKITFDAYAGISNPWKKIDVMDIEDYALLYDYMNNSIRYSQDGQLFMTKNDQGAYEFSQAKYANLDTIRNNTCRNWWDAVTRTGVKQNYNIAVSGGTDKTKFMVSANYYKEDGIVKGSDYNRFNARMNLNHKLASWLEMNANMTFTQENKQAVPEGQSSILKQALYQSPLTFLKDIKGYWATSHPIAVLDRYHDKTRKNRFDMNLGLTATFLKYFTYQFKASYYIIPTDRNTFTEVNKLNEDFSMPTDLTSVYRQDEKTSKWEINNLLTFNWRDDNNNLTVLVGQTAEGYKYQWHQSTRKGTVSNDESQWYLSSAYTGDKTYGLESDWTAVGILGRINYSLYDRYLLQVNMRIDGSSKFSKSNRWGYFPSVSVGWRFNNEAFLRDLEWLNLGKLRVGYGILGNNRIDELARYTYLASQYNYPYGVGNHILQPGVIATVLGNPDIKWEKAKTFNAGVDFGFFNNRLSASVEYFNKRTDDMLLEVPTVLSAGLTSDPMTNAGSVRNYGWEFSATHRNAVGDWRYEVGFNLSWIKNKVISLGTGNEPIYGGYLSEGSILDYVTKTEVGRPIGSFYGYVVEGIFQSTDEVAKSAQYEQGKNKADQTTRAGDFKFKDLNGDGQITPEDRTYLGSPLPDFVFGVPMSAGWKNWDLNLFFQGQTGNKIFNVMEYYLNQPSTGNVYADFHTSHWSGQLTEERAFWPLNTTSMIPDADNSDAPRNYRASNFYVKDGSYLRLKELRLSYTLPRNLTSRWGIDNVILSATAYNLLTFTKYNGLDPEVGRVVGTEGNNLNMGIDHGNYPQARSFTFGIKVSL